MRGGLCEICTVMDWFVPHALAGAAQLRALLICCKWILLAGKTKITIAAARCNSLVDPCSLSVSRQRFVLATVQGVHSEYRVLYTVQ
jgi:hypothetical protein